MHCCENALFSALRAVRTREQSVSHEYSQVLSSPRVELSKGYRMRYNLASFHIVYRTQQVEFARTGAVRSVNDEQCCPEKKAKEQQPTTLECIIR